MDQIETIGEVLGIAGVIGSVVWATINFWGRKSFVSSEDFEESDDDNVKRFSMVEGRIASLEETVKHLPSHKDIASLEQRMSTIASDVARMAGSSQSHSLMLEAIYKKLVSGTKD